MDEEHPKEVSRKLIWVVIIIGVVAIEWLNGPRPIREFLLHILYDLIVFIFAEFIGESIYFYFKKHKK